MWNNWFFFMDLDGGGSPYILRLDPLLPHSSKGDLLSQFGSFMDSSLHQSRFLYIPAGMAFQEACNRMSKLAGALLFKFSNASSSNLIQQTSGNQPCPRPGSHAQLNHSTSTLDNLSGFHFGSISQGKAPSPAVFAKISSFLMRLLREAREQQSFPVLSLAVSLVPPFDKLSSKAVGVPLKNDEAQIHASLDHRPCEVDHRPYSGISFTDVGWARNAVEPRTGIEFPMFLDNILSGENRSRLTSEVLVGTGSRTMTIIRIKTLKVYAFGFYVHPNSICKKLRAKYATTPVGELNNRQEFYQDLLREDISMTLRLVINCNGMKISSVKDAFEKSLRARLLKTNPDTDYNCLTTFGSFFTKDIPLPVGTTVDFRRTADGQLITEIGGNQIGAVQSKDLCRAFFDMYIGDVPVSEQTKEEIGKNVASMLKKC
ncbi:hypothetical protein Tsubulata_039962 [Turnera subulata]|uniref:Chalcone isomerase domain-containing protein n=1 Tax=Turnera subulata TaxID=218843 RepID=A0A9Q0JHN4_9ROSI|nr:hypothetical protein Tsubulata_039962 [Turnera subulata]